MSLTIANNELRSHTRSGVFVCLALALLLLLIGATTMSSARLSTFEDERAAAEVVDREVWDAQGDRNPHSAAHFARYAFKPVSELMAFDPGVTDYAGLALWMEAHNQNPAVFRRAEDLGSAGRFGDLSPAWILQYIAPLFLFLVLFASIAGEREQGTFRQIAASGIGTRSVLGGKLLAALAIIAGLMGAAFFLAFVTTLGERVSTLSDTALRSAGLVIFYSVYLVAVAALAVGISALFREKRTALIVLVGLWAVSFVLVPRLAASVAMTAYPVPSATELTADLRQASMTPWEDEEYAQQLREDLLDQYDVETVEHLPINFSGYELQASEKYSERLFEQFYERLDTIYEAQESVLQTASLVSPVLAMEHLSSGLAGTDRAHHRAFVWDAEYHRRVIIEQLNNDLTYNAAPGQTDYTNDETLWREVPDFAHQPPRFRSIASQYTPGILVLIAFLAGSLPLAGFAIGRARKALAA